MSKRVSNKKTRPTTTPARARVRYGWRKQKLRAASFHYLGHPNGTQDEIRAAIEQEQSHESQG